MDNRGQDELPDDKKSRARKLGFEGLSHLRNEGIFTDVVIAVPGHPEINAHKTVLAAASPFFQAMFQSDMRESASNRVEMPELTYETAQVLVESAYCGKYEIKIDNVENLLEAADCYQFASLKEECESFLLDSVDPSNCLELQKIAEVRRLPQLFTAVTSFFLDNFESIARSESFLRYLSQHWKGTCPTSAQSGGLEN